MLFYSLKDYNSKGWAKSKQGAWNCLGPNGCKDVKIWVILSAFPGTSARRNRTGESLNGALMGDVVLQIATEAIEPQHLDFLSCKKAEA